MHEDATPAMPSLPNTIPPLGDRSRPWRTSGGLWIGGARVASAPDQGRDAGRIQAALLKFPTTRSGRAVSVIETDTSLFSRALRAFTLALRGF